MDNFLSLTNNNDLETAGKIIVCLMRNEAHEIHNRGEDAGLVDEYRGNKTVQAIVQRQLSEAQCCVLMDADTLYLVPDTPGSCMTMTKTKIREKLKCLVGDDADSKYSVYMFILLVLLYGFFAEKRSFILFGDLIVSIEDEFNRCGSLDNESVRDAKNYYMNLVTNSLAPESRKAQTRERMVQSLLAFLKSQSLITHDKFTGENDSMVRIQPTEKLIVVMDKCVLSGDNWENVENYFSSRNGKEKQNE